MIVVIIYRDIPEQTILENIQRNLIGLSNSLFLAVGQKNDDNGDGKYNVEVSHDIRNQLNSRRGKSFMR
ncbi:hypothetical protein SDC9_131950 [bioreactor metagenome]|uniref:Uncharacterized protein n=1 Tax=bioreactor metagenome TaxID=1076179 RepID=A0A645D6B0_9ZZZZ